MLCDAIPLTSCRCCLSYTSIGETSKPRSLNFCSLFSAWHTYLPYASNMTNNPFLMTADGFHCSVVFLCLFFSMLPWQMDNLPVSFVWTDEMFRFQRMVVFKKVSPLSLYTWVWIRICYCLQVHFKSQCIVHNIEVCRQVIISNQRYSWQLLSTTTITWKF